LISCSGDENENYIAPGALNEGTIEFDVSYPYLDSNDIGLNLLPQKMLMKFKDGKYRIESEGGMGLFLTGYISDSKKKQMDYFLKIISSKFVSRFNDKGLKKLHKEFPAYRMEELDSTIEIAGYTCRGVKIIYYSNVVSDHNIWFTNEINLPESNWCNPFPDIKGVLLAYQVQRNGLVIDFKASRIINDSISDNNFKVPLDYRVISNRALIRKMEEAFIGFEY
jgi:hypothetical protein